MVQIKKKTNDGPHASLPQQKLGDSGVLPVLPIADETISPLFPGRGSVDSN